MRFKLACIAGLGLAVGPLAFAGEMAQSEALGRDLYALHCASCHGANLEGQPNGCGACHRGGSRRRRTTRPGTPGIIRMQRSSRSSKTGLFRRMRPTTT